MKTDGPSAAKLTSNISVTRPIILVLADGKTDGEQSHRRGHLFEKFVALLLQQHGYDEPTVRNLNVTSQGIELDVLTAHRLTKQKATAECKAYSKNLPVGDLSNFYGKVCTERFDDEKLTGFFVAVPGLTQDADERRKKIVARDSNFHVLTSEEIVALLWKEGIIKDPPKADQLRSDFAVVITEHGTYSAAKVLDQKSRFATMVQVWGVQPVPEPVILLIGAADYAAGLPVISVSDTGAQKTQPFVSIPSEPTIVEVVGSKSELEYQLPASPKFFVGRRDHIKSFKEMIEKGVERGGVLVLNGQSGWGKSSLSLQLKSVINHHGGFGTVYDSRTAASPEFVWQAVRKALIAAEKAGIVQIPADASYASLNSTVSTIRRAKWTSKEKPLLVFFDQFENVFRDVRLTQEFRDLSLAIRDVSAPVVIGFAWKTDLVGLTETYPYQLRDDIRSSAEVYIMEPLGPSEINTLLRRLEKNTGVELQKDLKQRLREVSQGLPWLFKKLASHVARELKADSTQDDLVSASLNVKKLFERDLAELVTAEREALKKIARLAPRAASDIAELLPSSVVQTLLDRRLIVQVGEFLDTYWDIFRDFLITGEVVVAESYILRQTPFAVAKILQEAIKAGGDLLVDDTVKLLDLKEGVVFNLSRELRLMGVLTDMPRHIHVSEDILTATDKEAAVRERISTSLKKHRVFAMLKEMTTNADEPLPLTSLAEALPRVFPAIEAKKKSWFQYARVFVNWLEYAGLADLSKDKKIQIPASDDPDFHLLSAESLRKPTRKIFPLSQPGPAIQIVEAIARGATTLPALKPTTQQKAMTDLRMLGILNTSKPNVYSLYVNPLDAKYKLKPGTLLAILEKLTGPKEAIRLIRRKPTAANDEVGAILKTAYGADWNAPTTQLMGKAFRAWARTAGVTVKRSERKKVIT